MNEEQIIEAPEISGLVSVVEALNRIAKALENFAVIAPAASGDRKPSLIDIIEGGNEE